MKYYNYDVVFQEIPDETTLAINISNCPCRCLGCHSKFLWEDVGTELTIEEYERILGEVAEDITCVCFMGGDANTLFVQSLAEHTFRQYPHLKIGWYTGRQKLPSPTFLEVLDYVKVGPYIKELGGLKSRNTNQRMYKVLHPTMVTTKLEDITSRFWEDRGSKKD